MDAWITLVVVIGIVALLISEKASATLAFLLGLAALVVFGIIDAESALSGFSNPTLFIIGALFVIAKAVQSSFDTEKLMSSMLSKSNSSRRILLSLTTPVAIMSAFLNNTPVVSGMIDPLIEWSHKRKVSPSILLIPLSYAAVIGGTLTLIGTSTNLTVSGLLTEYGMEPFSFFELTKVTLPVSIVLITMIIIVAPRLLPEKTMAQLDESDVEKQFIFDAKPKGKIVGKTIKQAGLRHLKDIYISALVRKNGDTIAAPEPDTIIRSGDTFRLSGQAKALANLKIDHLLHLVEEKHLSAIDAKSNYYEVVIGQNRSLSGRTIVELDFRNTYQAAVLAIFRAGEKIDQPVSSVSLRAGDSLILVSDKGFLERWQNRRDFLYVRDIGTHESAKVKNSNLLYLAIASIFVLLAIGAPLVIATMVGGIFIVMFRILNPQQALRAIDFELLIMIGAALGVAKAFAVSGLAEAISNNLLDIFGGLGLVGLLFGVILTTAILTELATNAAAALLVLPLALATASSAGYDPRLFAIAVAAAASFSFLSPFGYQTNTMVYSAGGYRLKDFVKIGLPMSISAVILLTGTLYIIS